MNGVITPAKRADIAHGSVWEWIHEMAANSPVQPIANLGTGFIEYNPPAFLTEAHRNATDNVEGNQYAPITGLPSLRQAIAQVWSPVYGRSLDAQKEICVHNGAQEGLLSCMMAFLQTGDEVILIEPVFELYVYQTKMAGATARYVPLRPPTEASLQTVSSNEWKLDMAELESAVTPKTKALILNNPHNPLGKVFDKAEVQAIGEFCISHNLILIADEVYERIAYNSTFTPAASLGPAVAARTLTAISLGKLFNATGWRVGFVIGSSELMEHVQAVHLVLAYASSSPAQEACARGLLKAEENGFWDNNCQDVAIRVRRIQEILDEIQLPYVKPNGAYFLLVNIDKIKLPEGYSYPQVVLDHGSKDWKVCFYLVNELGVTSIPGTCFFSPQHTHLGESYVRLGVCKSDKGLALARERLRHLASLVV